MRKKKILIIQDDNPAARDVENALRNLGYSVTPVRTADKRVMSHLEKGKFDLGLMDIMRKDNLNEIEIGRKIRERLDIPVISLTVHSEKKALEGARRTRPFGYLLKPVSEEKLEMAIELALCQHAAEKKSEERMRQALHESDNRYRQLIENISEGIVIQDKNHIITHANDKFLRMLGYSQHEVMGHPITSLLGEGWLRRDGRQGPKSEKDRWRSVEMAWNRKDGQRVFTILSPKPIYDKKGQFSGSVAVLTDITDRREAEIELRRSQEQLRSLSHHIQSVREKESKRIACEIHDVLGQHLTALRMDLAWLTYKIPFYKKEKENIIEKIRAMSGLIDETIRTVQKISAELRPGLLDDLGLLPAIEWLAQDFQSRTKIKCRTEFYRDEIDLDPDFATAIFRISQEALTNVARHAKATQVKICLKEENGALVLIIADNGQGIKKERIFAPSSLGLMGMRERVSAFGGELIIVGVPHKGTTLTATFPKGKN